MIKTNIQIRFADIDALRHVNNVCLQHYYDIGKSDYMREVLLVEYIWNGPGIVQANTNNNYYLPIYLYDKIEVYTSIKHIGNKSITMFQQIVDVKTSQIKSDSTSILVAFDINNQESIEIPQLWRERIIEYEGF